MTEMINTPAFASYDHEAALSVPAPVESDVTKLASNEHSITSDRDSAIFFDHADSPSTPPSRTASISLRHSLSTKSSTQERSDSSARRLCRPAEMNLGTNASSAARPKSELELRFDLIRNSQSQSKAALRSPTQLLNDRLNGGSLKANKQSRDHVRTFTPPKPMLNGCILPGPQAQLEAFSGWSVRGHTEKGNRPTWWCKIDKVVIFDGAEEPREGEEAKFKIRTSKGLTIARRRGDTETVIIPMSCRHCQDMLNRTEWKYDVQVCKRSVCWDCKERCKWEMEQEKNMAELVESQEVDKADARTRADSVLEDDSDREQELKNKIGIAL